MPPRFLLFTVFILLVLLSICWAVWRNSCWKGKTTVNCIYGYNTLLYVQLGFTLKMDWKIFVLFVVWLSIIAGKLRLLCHCKRQWRKFEVKSDWIYAVCGISMYKSLFSQLWVSCVPFLIRLCTIISISTTDFSKYFLHPHLNVCTFRISYCLSWYSIPP